MSFLRPALRASLCVLAFVLCGTAGAPTVYKVVTHTAITNQACSLAVRFSLHAQLARAYLGMRFGKTGSRLEVDLRSIFVGYSNVEEFLREDPPAEEMLELWARSSAGPAEYGWNELVRFGSALEDYYTLAGVLDARFNRHFAEVQNQWEGLANYDNGIEWAMRDSGNFFSFPQMMWFLRYAYLAKNQDEAERHFAQFFLAAGHLVHLVQDACQPSHTRNDIHLGSYVWGAYDDHAYLEEHCGEAGDGSGFLGLLSPQWIVGVAKKLGDPEYLKDVSGFDDVYRAAGRFSALHFVSDHTTETTFGEAARPRRSEVELIQLGGDRFFVEQIGRIATTEGIRRKYLVQGTNPEVNLGRKLAVIETEERLQAERWVDGYIDHPEVLRDNAEALLEEAIFRSVQCLDTFRPLDVRVRELRTSQYEAKGYYYLENKETEDLDVEILGSYVVEATNEEISLPRTELQIEAGKKRGIPVNYLAPVLAKLGPTAEKKGLLKLYVRTPGGDGEDVFHERVLPFFLPIDNDDFEFERYEAYFSAVQQLVTHRFSGVVSFPVTVRGEIADWARGVPFDVDYRSVRYSARVTMSGAQPWEHTLTFEDYVAIVLDRTKASFSGPYALPTAKVTSTPTTPRVLPKCNAINGIVAQGDWPFAANSCSYRCPIFYSFGDANGVVLDLRIESFWRSAAIKLQHYYSVPVE